MKLIAQPTLINAAGSPPKKIEEYVGRINTQTAAVSIARMISPPGWSEPRQRPAFDEYTVVLRGELRVEFEGGEFRVLPGQAVVAEAGEWVRYSTPGAEETEYLAVCLPAFSPESVGRES